MGRHSNVKISFTSGVVESVIHTGMIPMLLLSYSTPTGNGLSADTGPPPDVEALAAITEAAIEPAF